MGQVSRQRPRAAGTGPAGEASVHSSISLFISVVSTMCRPTLPGAGGAAAPCPRPSQPPAPLTASSCIFDKVIGIFLLTGFSLHFTCSFPRADSTGLQGSVPGVASLPCCWEPWQDSPVLIYFVF